MACCSYKILFFQCVNISCYYNSNTICIMLFALVYLCSTLNWQEGNDYGFKRIYWKYTEMAALLIIYFIVKHVFSTLTFVINNSKIILPFCFWTCYYTCGNPNLYMLKKQSHQWLAKHMLVYTIREECCYSIGFNNGLPWCVKHMAWGPPVTTKPDHKARGFCGNQRPKGHVFRTSWQAIVKTY